MAISYEIMNLEGQQRCIRYIAHLDGGSPEKSCTFWHDLRMEDMADLFLSLPYAQALALRTPAMCPLTTYAELAFQSMGGWDRFGAWAYLFEHMRQHPAEVPWGKVEKEARALATERGIPFTEREANSWRLFVFPNLWIKQTT